MANEPGKPPAAPPAIEIEEERTDPSIQAKPRAGSGVVPAKAPSVHRDVSLPELEILLEAPSSAPSAPLADDGLPTLVLPDSTDPADAPKEPEAPPPEEEPARAQYTRTGLTRTALRAVSDAPAPKAAPPAAPAKPAPRAAAPTPPPPSETERTAANLLRPRAPERASANPARPAAPERTATNLGRPAAPERTSANLARPAPPERTSANLARPPAQTPMPQQAAPATAPRAGVKMPELGPLNALMRDPAISEIMVNDVRNVMIEKEGRLVFAGFNIASIDELNRITRNILDLTGRLLSPDSPYVDTMLPDGSRVNIVGPPLTLSGPCITIRKFPERSLTLEDLVASGSLDRHSAHFLSSCVFARLNMLISGGTGSGKTTLLNALLSFVPRGERIILIEDTPELTLPHPNSVRLQTKPQTPSSAPVTARELVANALRMRPDRIIVGECRRAEAFDMLQAMNTGHEGSMTTIHANSTRDALVRLETLCMMSGLEIPLLAARKQIADALDLIVQIRRHRSGKRQIVAISEVTGQEGDTITLQEIFAFSNGSKTLRASGLVPTFVDRLREHGVEIPPNYFG